MRISFERLHADYASARKGAPPARTALSRAAPSLVQYDFLTLQTLADDLRKLLAVVPAPTTGGLALDLGSSHCPYRDMIESAGYALQTLDIDHESGADHVGRAEDTGLPDAGFDLVLCTQVLEHTQAPWDAMREIYRILRPGGHLIWSVPHVWFYHPHPHDFWRFTQEGMVHLTQYGGLELVELHAQGGTVLTVGQVANFLGYGLLGRWGSPLFLLVNLLTRAVDRLMPNDLFSHNFACLCRKALSTANSQSV